MRTAKRMDIYEIYKAIRKPVPPPTIRRGKDKSASHKADRKQAKQDIRRES